jgi:DnaJ-class molecular chaperone
MTFYQAFGVPEDASAEQLNTAWKVLMKRWHPDANPGADPRYAQEINRIYDILKDPEKRSQYDAWLAAQRRPVPAGWRIVATNPNVGSTTTVTYYSGIVWRF